MHYILQSDVQFTNFICAIFFSTGVTIGFENETYQSDEGQGSVEVCARVIDGGLQRDVEVTLVTQNGSAVGMQEKNKCVQLKMLHELFSLYPMQLVKTTSK